MEISKVRVVTVKQSNEVKTVVEFKPEIINGTIIAYKERWFDGDCSTILEVGKSIILR